MVTMLCFSDEALSEHKDIFTGFICTSLHYLYINTYITSLCVFV